MFVIQQIEEFIMSHHDTRVSIAQYVLKEKKNLYKYTIQDIAEATYTSKATVVRFAKALGYDGWKEFMKAFVEDLKYQETHQGDINANYPFEQNDTTDMIIQNIKELQIESLQDTYDLMNIQTIDRAVNSLYHAKQIYILGLSPNKFLGELFRRKMMTIGKSVIIVNAGEMGTTTRFMTKDDCVIIVSYSGNNNQAEPMCYIPILLENGVPMIGITSAGNNYIRTHLPCVLTISSKERLYSKISNFSTEESIQYIFNCLFACYYARDYQKYNVSKLQISSTIEKDRKAALNQMKDK